MPKKVSRRTIRSNRKRVKSNRMKQRKSKQRKSQYKMEGGYSLGSCMNCAGGMGSVWGTNARHTCRMVGCEASFCVRRKARSKFSDSRIVDGRCNTAMQNRFSGDGIMLDLYDSYITRLEEQRRVDDNKAALTSLDGIFRRLPFRRVGHVASEKEAGQITHPFYCYSHWLRENNLVSMDPAQLPHPGKE